MADWIIQGKTKAKRRTANRRRARGSGRPNDGKDSRYRARLTHLIVTEAGKPMTYAMLRKRFDDASEAACAGKEAFQFRDFRAKASKDKAESSGNI